MVAGLNDNLFRQCTEALVVMLTQCLTLGDCAFPAAAAMAWNNLLLTVEASIGCLHFDTNSELSHFKLVYLLTHECSVTVISSYLIHCVSKKRPIFGLL